MFYGGLYFDTAILVLRDIDDFLNNSAFIGYESDMFPFTAVFGAEKEHPFVKEMLEHYMGETDYTTNTSWVSQMLVEKYNCKLGNVEQQLDENIKVYRKELLCVPSKESYTVHAFTGSWREKNSLMSRISTFLRVNSNIWICRIIYSKIVYKIKEAKG